MTPQDEIFLRQNPAMIDRPDIARQSAVAAAQKGYNWGTIEHRTATKTIFDQHHSPQPTSDPALAAPAAETDTGSINAYVRGYAILRERQTQRVGQP